MHGRHCGLAESDTPADDFDDWRDAVRRAARARDDVLCAARYVGTVDERLDIHVLGWGGEENEASASSDVLLEVLAPRERSRALEYEVDAEESVECRGEYLRRFSMHKLLHTAG